MPHPSTRRYSTEQLLELGRDAAAKLGHRFTLGRFVRDTGIADSTIRTRFGSWSEFREQLGLTPHRNDEVTPDAKPRGRHVSDEWLFDKLREAVPALGRDMNLADFCNFAGVSSTTIVRRFKGWLEFRRRAGLPPKDRRNYMLQRYTRDEIIDRLRVIAPQVGPDITLKEFLARTGIADGTFYRYFKSWSQIREYVDLPPHGRQRKHYSDDFLFEDLYKLTRHLNRFPTQREYDAHGVAHSSTIKKRIGPDWDDVRHRLRDWVEHRRTNPPKLINGRPFSELSPKEKADEIVRVMQADAANLQAEREQQHPHRTDATVPTAAPISPE